jgi:acetoin utilization deacetylase AcuC-like enzyme
MTLLYTDPRFLDHQTGTHPERPERLRQVVRHLERVDLFSRCIRPQWEIVSDDRLRRVHHPEYAAWLDVLAAKGGGRVEEDTVISPASVSVARYASGAACDAVRRVVDGEDANALCLVRPPGHHALADAVMGFCLFNHVAVAARMATVESGLSRVLVVDWDVHHGNGTQAAFWTDPQVGFLSIHRWPFYPGTGDAGETGSGAGLGTTVNLPVAFGTSRRDYLDHFRNELERFSDHLRPELILISAGFDSHRDDPIGSLGLEVEDFDELTRMVSDVAKAQCGGRIVSILEGGYNPGILAACIEVHLKGLLGPGGQGGLGDSKGEDRGPLPS